MDIHEEMNICNQLNALKPILMEEIIENMKLMSDKKVNTLIDLYLEMLNDESESLDRLIIEYKAQKYAEFLLSKNDEWSPISYDN